MTVGLDAVSQLAAEGAVLESSKEPVKLVGRRSYHLCDALNACNSLAELPL
jgi:hypothetical protein